MTQVRSKWGIALLLALLGVGGAAAPAHAQLGGLIKKKLDKAVDKQAGEVTAVPPTFDDVIIELTPERLTAWMKGDAAGQRFNETPNGPPHFQAMRDEAARKLDDLNSRIGNKAIDYKDSLEPFRRCRRNAADSIRHANQAAMMRQMPPDPAIIKEQLDMVQAVTAAQARGDTAEVRRINEKFMARFDPKPAQIAEAERRCGPPPAPPADVKEVLTQEELIARIDAQLEKATDELNRLEEEASGLTAKQIAVARERICAYVAAAEKLEGKARYSSLELHALKEKYAELLKHCPKPK